MYNQPSASTPSADEPALKQHLPIEGASTLAPSPNATPLESATTSSPDGRNWSSAFLRKITSPKEDTGTGSKGSGIFRYIYRRRTTASTGDEEMQLLEKLKQASDRLSTLGAENEKLMLMHEAQQRELQIKEDQLETLKMTNEYCRTLLARNSELELLIAQIQDEYQAKIRTLNEEIRSAHRTSSLSKEEELSREKDRILRELEHLRENYKRVQAQNEMLDSNARKLERDLAIATSAAEGFRGQVESITHEHDHLRSLHRKELKTLGATSSELSVLASENDRLTRMVDELKEKTYKMSIDFDQRRIDLETDLKSREVDLRNLEARYDESIKITEELQKRLQTFEGEGGVPKYQETIETLQAELAEVRVGLESEVQRLTTENMTLKSKLRSYEGIHETAQQALQRNGELEKSLNYYIGLSKNTGNLKEELRQAKAMHLEAEANARAMHSEIKLLEGNVARLTEHLRLAQEQLVNDSTPRQDREPHAFEKAVKVAVERCKHDHDAHVRSITQKYDLLVREIRETHEHAMREREREFERALEGKERESMRQLETERITLEQEMAAKYRKELADLHGQRSAELESYKRELNHEMNLLMDRQRQLWQQRIDAKDQEATKIRQAYEEQLRLLEAEKDKEIRSAAIEMDALLTEKEKEITMLKASFNSQSAAPPRDVIDDEANSRLDALRSSYEKQLEEARNAIAKLRDEHAEKIASLEQAKNDQISRLRSQLDAAVSQSLSRSVDATKQFQDSLDAIVTEATGGISQRLEKLKEDYALVMQNRSELEREKSQLERANIQLKTELEKSRDSIAALEEKIRDLSKAAPVPAPSDKDQIERLVQRNRDLEETIATISEKYHDDMKKRAGEILELQNHIRQQRIRSPSVSRLSTEQERSFQQDLREKQSQIARLEREKISMQREISLRVSEVDALRSRLSLPVRDSRMSEQLLEKIEALQATLSDMLRLDAEAEKNAKEAAEARANRIKLQGQISYLENETDKNLKRIRELEETLKKLRRRPSSPDSNAQVMQTVRTLQQERSALKETCKRLEEELSAKENLVETEIQKRNNQLKALETTNQYFRRQLERNDRLEEDIAKLMKDFRDRVNAEDTSYVDVNDIKSCISTLEEHLVSRTRTHDMETQRLSSKLTERESEVERLREELINLKKDLERVFARKYESARLRYESERDALVKENEELKRAVTKMETELTTLRTEVVETESLNKQRMESMIENLCKQIESHQMMIAEVQDERDIEVAKVKRSLEKSEAGQNALREEIELISSTLAEKDREISNLTRAVNDVIAEAETEFGSQTHSEAPDAGRLRQTFHSLMSTVQSSQQEAQKFMTALQALLDAQEGELRTVEMTRKNMASLVSSNMNAHSAQGKVLSEEKSLMDQQLKDVAQSSQIHQSILGTLKERATMREAELAELSARLNLVAQRAVTTCDPVHEAVQSLSSRGPQLAALYSEAKDLEAAASALHTEARLGQHQSYKKIHRHTVESWSRLSTSESLIGGAKRREAENASSVSTPQPTEDLKRQRLS